LRARIGPSRRGELYCSAHPTVWFIGFPADWALQLAVLPREKPRKRERIPTQIGDVLILSTKTSCQVHAAGPVTQDGQQALGDQTCLSYVPDEAKRVMAAKALVIPGRRIFRLDIDADDWKEI